MNIRNINVMTSCPVPDKTVSDNIMHTVFSNCVTTIEFPVPKKFIPESLPRNFNKTSVGVMKKGCRWFYFLVRKTPCPLGRQGMGKPYGLLNYLTGLFKI